MCNLISKYRSSDEWVNDLTKELDKFNIRMKRDKRDPKFWEVYMYDLKYYLDRGLKYKDQITGATIVDRYIYVPIRIPGCTIGCLCLNENHVLKAYKLYDSTCFGSGRLERNFTDGARKALDRFIGRKLVIES